jgi:hypothetical protein
VILSEVRSEEKGFGAFAIVGETLSPALGSVDVMFLFSLFV